MTDVAVVGLRVEHHDGEPLSVGTPTPRLSWRSETTTAGWTQAGWEVDVVDALGKPRWQSGRQEGAESVLVAWGGEPLSSRTACTWRARVWGSDGSASAWSDAARFEVGLLNPSDWSAHFVAPAWEEDVSASQPAPYVRSTFSVGAEPVRARLHITALGIYDAAINGQPVGDHRLAPGWTAYDARVHVQTFDVTAQLRAGDNVIEAVVADGWYRGWLGFAGNRNNYGDRSALIAQLEIDFADGRRQTVVTDDSWEATTGPILAADIYNGETHDARVVPGPWTPMRSLDVDLGRLVPQPTPPVRTTDVVKPIAITTSPSGKTIVDFGQNLVGVLRIRVQGPAGTTVTLRHAEVLEDGELCTRILRAAQATDHYTLGGDAIEEWSPHFTFHGFRYAEVDGWPGELTLEDLDALVMHTDMTRTGWFECDNELVNQLHRNIVWGWRGNTVSVPTDCPQRDERLGWTGDLQVFTPTAAFIYDAAGFLDGWLRDLAADQLPNGCVPAVIPDILRGMQAYACGWGDAATVVPTAVYHWYGDTGILEQQFESMRSWVDSIAERAGPGLLWNNDFQFGDWVDPTVDPLTPGNARTDSSFVATAYFAHSADLVANAADVLDKREEAEHYRSLAARVRDAFCNEWVAPSGRVVADTQTGCALALAFDMVSPGQRPVVADRLRQLVKAELYRLSTGFLGTPVVTAALSDAGFLAEAYRMLLQTQAPGWMYPVTAGATTIWERWDALRPDGTMNPGSGMLSFNHYALGAVGHWLHSTVGGLTATAPGFRRFRVAPQPGIGISAASAQFDSRYGRIEVRWAVTGRGMEMRVVVPPNTEAEVVLPGRDGVAIRVGSGHHRWQYVVDPDTYRRWVPAPFRLTTPVGELRANAEAWAAVEEHAPELIARCTPDVDEVPLRSLVVGTAGLQQLLGSPLTAALAALCPLPDPPDEVMA
jgi:alpha-L-rhamnosidase